MKLQPRTARNIVISVLLSAILLLTSCLGCAVAYAATDGNTVTFMCAVDTVNDGAYAKHSAQQGVSVGQWINLPQMGNSPWYRFDGWYADAERTVKAPSVLTADADLTLYAAYVFNVGLGDINADGLVNADDITLFRKYIVGGYEMEIVPDGGEWDVAKPDGGTFQQGKTYFVERVAGVAGSRVKSPRNLTNIRAALIGGYGIDVYGGVICQTQTVYFHNAENWTTPYVYAWNGARNTSWPGQPMQAVSGATGWYSAKIPADMSDVIFNDGNGAQTADLTFNADTPYYAYNAWHSEIPATKTVYFYNSENWSQVAVHNWGGSMADTTWPGTAMKAVSNYNGWFSAEIPADRTMVVFNNNQGKQTSNLTLNDGKLYCFNEQWYDSLSTTVYYYNEAVSTAYAYYWNGNGGNNVWPGAAMTPVRGEVGLFSIEVPREMVNIQFNAGGDNKYADNLTINRSLPCYSQYGDWRNRNDRFVQVIVDGVAYNMIPRDTNGSFNYDNGEYMLTGVYLQAGQTVEVKRFGVTSGFENDVLTAGVAVATTGYYDFYCKYPNSSGKGTWVGKQ